MTECQQGYAQQIIYCQSQKAVLSARASGIGLSGRYDIKWGPDWPCSMSPNPWCAAKHDQTGPAELSSQA